MVPEADEEDNGRYQDGIDAEQFSEIMISFFRAMNSQRRRRVVESLTDLTEARFTRIMENSGFAQNALSTVLKELQEHGMVSHSVQRRYSLSPLGKHIVERILEIDHEIGLRMMTVIDEGETHTGRTSARFDAFVMHQYGGRQVGPTAVS